MMWPAISARPYNKGKLLSGMTAAPTIVLTIGHRMITYVTADLEKFAAMAPPHSLSDAPGGTVGPASGMVGPTGGTVGPAPATGPDGVAASGPDGVAGSGGPVAKGLASGKTMKSLVTRANLNLKSLQKSESVGRCRLTASNSLMNALMVSALEATIC
jgi:hypothetical protein